MDQIAVNNHVINPKL